MFLKTEFSLPRAAASAKAMCGLLAAAALLVLAGCSSGPALRDAGASAGGPATPPPISAKAPLPAPPADAPAQDAALRLLAYADRLRLMPAAELGPEVARLGEASSPAAQLQLALALGQLRQLPELVRAQELLARVLANDSAQALHPLARLLATRYGEQRRVEEQLDKQTQLARELQRKLDQSNERLEALKAIERSLTSRPAAATPAAPARRERPAAP